MAMLELEMDADQGVLYTTAITSPHVWGECGDHIAEEKPSMI